MSRGRRSFEYRKNVELLCVRQNWKCKYCRRILTLEKLSPGQHAHQPMLIDGIQKFYATVDHLVRVADGGSDDIENLVASCEPCNRCRDAKTEKEKLGKFVKCRLCGNDFKRGRRRRRHCPACRQKFAQNIFLYFGVKPGVIAGDCHETQNKKD